MNGVRGIKIGRVSGIDIAFDASWIFIVLLMTWSLTVGFSRGHPTWGFGLSVLVALLAALLFFASVLLHELAHSFVARRFGVPVRSITLFLFGGVSNIEREPPSPKAEFWTAVVGPLTSIGLGILLLVIGSAVTHSSSTFVNDPSAWLAALGPAETILMWLGPINILVGVFNLIPGFPLDGGRILRSAIWAITHDLHVATRWASAVGQAIGWALVFLGIAMAFGAQVPFFGRGFVSGLWLAFIGWFLSSAAAATWRTQLMHEALEGLSVSRLMRPAARSVPAGVDMATFVHEWLMRSDDHAFPVVDESGRVIGLITMRDVRGVPRDAWASVPVARVMTPFERLVTTSPREGLADAMDKLTRAGVNQLPVYDGGALVGMLHRGDIARWIELNVQPTRRTHAPT
jgi:Zn-dependent protease/predicted transcriptional regulator